ncbi:MBL fold metallo-hydrolase, partial [candidate division TA06 bacterium SM1_40]
EVDPHAKICENVYSTGELGTRVKEQALIIHTARGLIVMTGCAHPGIVHVVERAKDLIGEDVLLVIGGFHLGPASSAEIEGIVASIRELGVRYIAPCHCSGDAARELFHDEYEENYIEVGVGSIITMEDLS